MYKLSNYLASFLFSHLFSAYIWDLVFPTEIGYQDETNTNSVEDQSYSNFYSLIGGDVTHWFWPGIWQVYIDLYDLKSLSAE
jgi:hypothetical protein